MANFSPFPYIETKNLILRKMNYGDTDDLFEMRNDLRMNEHTDTKPDETTDDTRNYIDKMNKGVAENRWIIWAIVHKQSNKAIGSICIWNLDRAQGSGELGYGIIPGYQGRGLMKEALSKVIEFGFEVMNLDLLEAYTEENNLRSIRLLEKLNFLEVDRVDDEGCYNNRIYHMVVYRLKNSKKIVKRCSMEKYRFVYKDKEYQLGENNCSDIINDEDNPVTGIEQQDILELLSRKEAVDFDVEYYDQPCQNCLAGKKEKDKYFKFLEYHFFIFTKKGRYVLSSISKEYEGNSFTKLLKQGVADNSYIVSVAVCVECGEYSIEIEQCEI